MTISEPTPRALTLQVEIDPRRLTVFQVPTVHLHASVMSALGLPDLTLVTVRRCTTGKATAAWAVRSDDSLWDTCPTPWHATVRLSVPVWREIGDGEPPASGERLEILVGTAVMPVRPTRIERVLAGHEIGLHADDARRLGLRRWAVVNHAGIPAACRVRTTQEDRDRGHVRLSYQARMLLGLPPGADGLRPEIFIAPPPARGRRRLLRVGEPRWSDRRVRWPTRLFRRAGTGVELTARAFLRAPALSFRTIEATPGEDRLLTVRLADELFPLLGTQPGKQVYLEWGPGNRTIVTALALGEIGQEEWPEVAVVGHRPDTPRPPDIAVAAVGAMSRAALGIPRTTIVTVRRRVGPLIVTKLNELIVPTTALMIALTADIKLRARDLLISGAVIVVLLLAPLRIRRNPRGRIK